MANGKEEWNVLKVVCLVAGFFLITSIVRFGLGYDSILASAGAGAIGALFGTLVYEVIKKARGQ
jgi:hypothetical protein